MKHTFRDTECGRSWTAKLGNAECLPRARVLFLDIVDDRMLDATNRLADERFVEPVLIRETLEASSRVNTAGNSHDTLRDSVDDLSLGAELLNRGEVDAVIAGANSLSSKVIRTGIKSIGVSSAGVVSSYFLMIIQQRLEAYADCAVIPDPSAEQLAQIAVDTSDNFHALTRIQPRIAFLSFSTLGSAKHEKIEKVKRAVEIARRARPVYAIDGELQFDAACVSAVAQKKAPNSEVAGNANVYIFPDLEAGNIAYKVAERVGGASAIGPILQGLRKPWLDLSRGCSVDDIIDLALIAAAIVYERGKENR